MLLYSYQDDVDIGTRVFFEFDDAFVRSLFRDHSVLYWEQRRPPVVIWLALDEPFSRRFAARSDDVELLSPSLDRFEARGLEVRFPLLDLADSVALPVNSHLGEGFRASPACFREIRYGVRAWLAVGLI